VSELLQDFLTLGDRNLQLHSAEHSMRALSIGQPWATLIVRGVKPFEARTWSTSYRGEIAVHASSSIKGWVREECETNALIRKALKKAAIIDLDELPRGAVVGTVVVADVHRAKEIESDLTLTIVALCGGDLYEDDLLWRLERPKELRTPISVKGKLNLWTLPESVVTKVASSVRRPA
jgi:activating signal cointegrator 1